MPNYKETTVNGTAYVRAKELVVRNELNGLRGIGFVEEQVVTVGNEPVARPYKGVFKEFTPGNATTSFPMLDADGNPTGATATFMDVYLLLSSLYYYVAQERDLNEQA